MDDLLAVIAELGLELHPDRISIIASKIMTLGSVEQFALARPSFGPNADKELVDAWIGRGVIAETARQVTWHPHSREHLQRRF